MADEDPQSNVFRRFKSHVDTHVAKALQGLIGLPSVVLRDLGGQWPSASDSGSSLSVAGRGAAIDKDSSNQQPSDESSYNQKALLDQLSWLRFAIQSPYSPLNLRNLPQPIPRDLPEDADPTLFSFEDAFEDLITVAQGQSMQGINEKYRMKKELRDTFHTREFPLEWLYRLRRNGLLTGWDPQSDMPGMYAFPGWPTTVFEDGFHHWNLPVRGIFEECDRIFKEIERHAETHDADHPDHPDLEAGRTEEDLFFDMIRRSFSNEPDRSLASMIRKAMEESNQVFEDPLSKPTKQTSPSTRYAVKGGRVEERSEEEVDESGNKTITRTKVTFNDKDEEVSRETECRIFFRSTSQANPPASSATGTRDTEGRNESVGPASSDTKPGWFWK